MGGSTGRRAHQKKIGLRWIGGDAVHRGNTGGQPSAFAADQLRLCVENRPVAQGKIGGGYEARLGTNLSYAPAVIGTESQQPAFRGRWWTMKTVMEKAKPGIERLFEAMAGRLVGFLEGR